MAKRRGGLDREGREQMDDLARAVVMVRAGACYEIGMRGLRWFGRCECCSSTGPLQWSHILGQGEAPRMKWVPENAMAQVRGCHYRWTNHPSFRDQVLAVVLHRRCPGDFAQDWQAYRARLHALAGQVGQPIDHAAQRLANVEYLKRHAPAVLADLAGVWERRARKGRKA